MNAIKNGFITVLLAGALAGTAFGQVSEFRLEPPGAEIEVCAGGQTTTSFLIRAEHLWILRDKLTLSVADQEVNKDGIVIYSEPGTVKHSASAWLNVYPVTVTLMGGDSKLIRVIVRVPEDVEPGLYTSAVLVEQKAAGPPVKLDGAPTTTKIFSAFTLYITVRPPAPRGVELSLR